MNLAVALLGAGEMGKMRARVIADEPGLRLVSVVDTDLGAAQRLARPLSAHSSSHYQKALDDPQVEAVVISTPTHLHQEMALAALQAGKHVLCEKPLAPKVEDCRRLLQAASDCGRHLAVGFNHRFYPCFARLKGAVDSGALGRVQHVRALCGHQGISEFRAEWNYRSQYCGAGVSMDLGIHLTDLIDYLFGPIDRVFGRVGNQVWKLPGSEDHAAALMTTRSGVDVAYHATWGEWKGFRLLLEVYGTEALARAYYAPMLYLSVQRSQGRPRPRWSLYPWINLREKLFGWQTTATKALAQEMREFVKAIRGQPSLGADGAAGYRAVAVAHSLHLSQQSGKPVEVDA